jgi:hypothetical protein
MIMIAQANVRASDIPVVQSSELNRRLSDRYALRGREIFENLGSSLK